jgi:hypothetical protein
MNRSYSKIRHIQESNVRLEKRTIMEMDRSDRERNYIEGPYSMGNANYEKNHEKFNKEMRQKDEERKFHVPGYDTSSGRGWNDETLRAFVEENYGVELPDDLRMYPGIVSNWLKENGYERL